MRYEGSIIEFAENLKKSHWKLYVSEYNKDTNRYLVGVYIPSRPDIWAISELDLKYLLSNDLIVNAEVSNYTKIDIYETPSSANFLLFAHDVGKKSKIDKILNATVTKRDLSNNRQYISIKASDKKTDITDLVYALLKLSNKFKECYLTETGTICIPDVSFNGIFWLIDLISEENCAIVKDKYYDLKKKIYIARV